MKGILPGIICLLLSYLLVVFLAFGGVTIDKVASFRVIFNMLSIVSLACFSYACVINKLYMLFISFLLDMVLFTLETVALIKKVDVQTFYHRFGLWLIVL